MFQQLQMHSIVRVVLLIFVTGIWILAGFFDTIILGFLETLLSSNYLGASLMDKIPLYVYYSLYCGLCLCIIHLAFLHAPTTRLAIFIYLVLFILTVALNEVGKLLVYEPFRITAYRMMTIIVSPFLLILIIPAKYFFQRNNNKAQNATDGDNITLE